MTRLQVSLLAAAILCTAAVPAAARPPSGKPNILIIFADDFEAMLDLQKKHGDELDLAAIFPDLA